MLKNLVIAAILGALAFTAWEIFDRNGDGAELEHHEDIIVYTSNNCGLVCRDMVGAIRREGEHVYVVNLDEDHEAQDELARKLEAIGFNLKIYRLPVVDVYGEIYPDAPAIKKILSEVRSKRE